MISEIRNYIIVFPVFKVKISETQIIEILCFSNVFCSVFSTKYFSSVRQNIFCYANCSKVNHKHF